MISPQYLAELIRKSWELEAARDGAARAHRRPAPSRHADR
jgi:hypothetical protein